MLYVVDRDGWLRIHPDVSDVEHSLEEIDVASREYVIIDEEGTVFTAIVSDDGPRGFRLKSTGVVAAAALAVLMRYSDDDQLAKTDLEVVRSA